MRLERAFLNLEPAAREDLLGKLNEDELFVLERSLYEDSFAEFFRGAFGVVDPATYRHAWHVDAIAEHLEAFARGEISNLLITMPPGRLKSLAVTVTFVPWVWAQPYDLDGAGEPVRRGAGPWLRFLWASYQEDLSTRDSVKSRRLIDSSFYQLRWGKRFKLTTDQNTKTRFENDRLGRRISTSVHGLGTGERGDVVAVDDPHNVLDVESERVRVKTVHWWFEVMSSRVNPADEPDAVRGRLVVQQRTHPHDVAGAAIEREPDLVHLCLPERYEPDHPYVFPADPRTKRGELLNPEVYPEETVTKLEAQLGSYQVACQLQQRPTRREGGLFKRGDLGRRVAAAELPAGRTGVRGWDLAATDEEEGGDPSWTCGLLLSRYGETYFVEHVTRGRWGPLRVETNLKKTAEADGAGVRVSIPQDPGQAGKAQARHLVALLAGYVARATPESGSKLTRAEAVAAQAEAGNLVLVEGAWNDVFVEEVVAFPTGDHTDQVDALSRAFSALALVLEAGGLGDPGDLGQRSYWTGGGTGSLPVPTAV